MSHLRRIIYVVHVKPECKLETHIYEEFDKYI
jgi:hypothetical protein